MQEKKKVLLLDVAKASKLEARGRNCFVGTLYEGEINQDLGSQVDFEYRFVPMDERLEPIASKYDAVIPWNSVDTCASLSKQKIDNCIVFPEESIYAELDLKDKMTKFAFPAVIPQIPTLIAEDGDERMREFLRDCEELEVTRLMYKPVDGMAGIGMFKKPIEDFDPDLAKGFVVQPCLEDHRVWSIHFHNFENEIKGYYFEYYPPLPLKNHLTGRFAQIYLDKQANAKTEKIFNFTKSLCVENDIRGVCGLEFLETKNGDLYLMEVNPRFTGAMHSVEKNGVHVYHHLITRPYLRDCGVEVEQEVEFEFWERDGEAYYYYPGAGWRDWTVRALRWCSRDCWGNPFRMLKFAYIITFNCGRKKTPTVMP
jgi:glutathione synthase/RimK-type ligase-like ATP-grasp enzyme